VHCGWFIEVAFLKGEEPAQKSDGKNARSALRGYRSVLEAVSKEDTRGFFEHCGYNTPQDHSL
jgi:hypothetical protein